MGLTLNDFFATQGMSPLFQEAEAFVAEMGQKPDGLRNLFRSALASPLRARPWCVEPLVRPPQAPATSAAPSRSAASSEPRPSLAGRDIRPRETRIQGHSQGRHRSSSCNWACSSHHFLQPAHCSCTQYSPPRSRGAQAQEIAFISMNRRIASGVICNAGGRLRGFRLLLIAVAPIRSRFQVGQRSVAAAQRRAPAL